MLMVIPFSADLILADPFAKVIYLYSIRGFFSEFSIPDYRCQNTGLSYHFNAFPWAGKAVRKITDERR